MSLPPTTPHIDPLTTLREQIAADLLQIGALVLRPDEPFTWASGLRAPVYCDNRLTLAYPAIRSRVTAGFQELIGRSEAAPDAVAGVATAGIPQAALVADQLGLPLAYVRASVKGHGRENRIEGRLEAGQRVVLVEDLISTGGSSAAAAEALRAAGTVPTTVLAIFSYGLDAAAGRFAEAGLAHATLTDFDTLLRVAERAGALASSSLGTLRAWRADPEGWSQSHRGTGGSED
ncbi:MAG: orotate phosphoribosyltransferase [Bacteroidota bacterium]